MSTQISELCELDQECDDNIDFDDLQSIVMDLSLPINTRIQGLVGCYEQNENRAVECLSTLASQYLMSGIKNLETFLRTLCEEIKLPAFFRLEAVKALLEYEELEEDSEEEDSEELNINIRNRNKTRKKVAAAGLEAICLTMDEIPTPCRVEALYLLMEYPEHKSTATKCFKQLVNDQSIECDFRYKCILDLEHHGAAKMREKILYDFDDKDFVKDVYTSFSLLIEKEFPKFKPSTSSFPFFKLLIEHLSYNQLLQTFRKRFPITLHLYEYFLYESLLEFMNNISNYTSYRILASQYVLQKFSPDKNIKNIIQLLLLDIAQDTNLHFNLRADAADVLMQLGDKNYKELGRLIIEELGGSEGKIDTVFHNSQNVHTTEVDACVTEVLEFFANLPLMKINNVPIEFCYVEKQIKHMLKLQRDKQTTINKNLSETNYDKYCKYCGLGLGEEKSQFLTKECEEKWNRDRKINLALNRIHMDRALYSRYNSTLVNILLKVWTYLSDHEHELEMKKRLLEELEEMCGTCSSGFASRLINVISGFGEFSIRISWEDQIKANFFGRLNASARKITSTQSIFRQEKHLIDLVILCLNEDFEADQENSIKSKILEELKDEINSQKFKQEIIVNKFLEMDKENKIQQCLEQLQESVLNEISISSSLSAKRQYFSLFLRVNIPLIREEMYAEFKQYLDDTTFDLYMRKAFMAYEA